MHHKNIDYYRRWQHVSNMIELHKARAKLAAARRMGMPDNFIRGLERLVIAHFDEVWRYRALAIEKGWIDANGE